jgi:hypothetical protein
MAMDNFGVPDVECSIVTIIILKRDFSRVDTYTGRETPNSGYKKLNTGVFSDKMILNFIIVLLLNKFTNMKFQVTFFREFLYDEEKLLPRQALGVGIPLAKKLQ